ncbi:MAG: hypothetical protein IJX63_15050 [Lachnospiraceae bacterium]|nr:hypothetical protein [Lachnospiraceae bacterium]
MAKVLLAFLLKENVPAGEAEELVEKVRKKKVGELFANMEKMDIQAERRKTKMQEERAEKAERQAETERQKAEPNTYAENAEDTVREAICLESDF